MKSGLLTQVILALGCQLGTTMIACSAEAAGNFMLQAERLYQAIRSQCTEPFSVLPADDFSGAMFRCTSGTASFVAIAAKFPEAENLRTVRVSWNDLFNSSAGAQKVHADRGAALFFVTAAATLYAPALAEDILSAFEADQPRTWEAEG